MEMVEAMMMMMIMMVFVAFLLGESFPLDNHTKKYNDAYKVVCVYLCILLWLPSFVLSSKRIKPVN